MAEFSALPLWTDAFLADTTHLNALETGAYLLLLMASWRTEDGGLPNDDETLRRYAKANVRQWNLIRATVLGFFDTRNDGRLIQKRLEKERDYVRSRSTQGAKGAQARWLKHKETLSAEASPRHMPKGSKPDARRMPKASEVDAKHIAPATAPVSVPDHDDLTATESGGSSARARHDRDDPGIEQFVPEAPDAPDPATKPAFLRRHLTQQAIPPHWRPSTMAIQRLRASRPDMTDAQIAEETERFLSWCAETNKTSFSAEDTWLNFMRKTHVSKPASEDEFDDPGTRAIAAAVARRYPNG